MTSTKGTPYGELGLGDPVLSDAQLLDAMMARPDGCAYATQPSATPLAGHHKRAIGSGLDLAIVELALGRSGCTSNAAACKR